MKLKTVVIPLALSLLHSIHVLAEPPAGNLNAAVVKVDITPAPPQTLESYSGRKSTEIHDRLFHRVVALDDGNTQFFLISTDITAISPALYDRVAEELERRYEINPLHIWWTVTHTHSVPGVGPRYLKCLVFTPERCTPFDTAYTSLVEEKLIEAIGEAREKLAPARLGVGWGFSQANINRRALDIDGKASLGRNPDGPVDRRIGLLRLDKADGSPLALIANYPIHGTVLGGQSTVISGDVPGVVAQYVEQQLGAPLLFINGAAGNLAPIYSAAPNPEAGHLMQFRALLGDKILKANKKITTTTDEITLSTGSLIVETPLKVDLDMPSALSKYFRTTLSGNEVMKLPVRFLKISDDVAIWGAPIELFVEVANEVRDHSPFPYTFYFGYTNGGLGYLPTAAAWTRGGYEPSMSPFTPAAAGDLMEAVLNYLQDPVFVGK